jgi:hypothetical protein
MIRRGLLFSSIVFALLGLHLLIRLQMPFTFWYKDADPPVMSLAEAVNIDYWLARGGSRPVSEAQVYQPAIPFQVLSWLMYRLSARDWRMSVEELFGSTLSDPHAFWWEFQTLPLLLSVLAIILVFWRARRLDLLTGWTASAIYFSGAAALNYGVIQFFNESLSLLFAMLFFSLATAILRDVNQSIWRVVICGGVGAILYVHKMNYVVWAIALLPAFWAQTWLKIEQHEQSKVQAIAGEIKRDLVFLFTLFAGVKLIGSVVLGKSGFQRMLHAHRDLIMGSGIHGAGSKTIVSLSVMLKSVLKLLTDDPITAVLILLLLILPAIIVARKWRNLPWLKQFLPTGALLWVAMAMMTLAIIKHYVDYYLVAVTAIFPLMLIWIRESGAPKWIVAGIAAVALAGFLFNSRQVFKLFHAEYQVAQMLAIDEATIRRLPDDGRPRLLTYQLVVPLFQRLFLVQFSGMPELEKMVDEVQGNYDFFSPWSSTLPSNWHYLVVQKRSLKFLDRTTHSILFDTSAVRRTELQQMILFENLR